jgi:methionyl-tRNA formyltransferase
MNKRTCVLLLRSSQELNKGAVDICEEHLDLLAIRVRSPSFEVDEEELAARNPDLVISFLQDFILRGPLLKFRGVNFHPAPPRYPGRGGASRALYNGDGTFGATAHLIAAKVDAGEIVDRCTFHLNDEDTCADIYQRAEQFCLMMLERIVGRFANTGEIGWPLTHQGLQWGTPMTRRGFEEWLIVRDLNDQDELNRKVRAAKHPRFPGPYVYVHGHRFAYCGEGHDAKAAV